MVWGLKRADSQADSWIGMQHAPDWLQLAVLYGGPGLLVGILVGLVLHRWRAVFLLVAAGAVGAYLLAKGADDPTCDDDCPEILAALFAFFNLIGWTVGLAGGTGYAKLARHRR